MNERVAPFRVLRGTECDILADGTLDLPDDVLAELDWVQASVHAGQRQSRDQLTKRTLAAVEHPAVRSISHPPLCPSQFKYVRPEHFIDQAEPLVSFDPLIEGCQHLLAPDSALGSVA